MTHYIDIQHACTDAIPLMDDELHQLANLALREKNEDVELTIRLVDAAEMIHLNSTYRNQNKTTNVLAFPSDLPEDIALEYRFLGDVIICPEVLIQECAQRNKSLKEHWSLIVMHGILHLLGYDHINDADAAIMQALEIKLLAELGFANPYHNEDIEVE